MAEFLSDWCERNEALHIGQVGSRKNRNSIDAVRRIMKQSQLAWARGNKSGLFVDVNGAFDHVSKNCLLRYLKVKGVDVNIVRWVQSFK